MAGGRLLLQGFVLVACFSQALSAGILYPRDSESRVVKILDGMWNFRADVSPSRNQSFVDQWWMKPLSAVSCLRSYLVYFKVFKVVLRRMSIQLSDVDWDGVGCAA